MKWKSRFRVGNKFLVFISLHTAVLTLYQLTGWFISVFQRVPWNDFLINLFHKSFINICIIGNNILTSEDNGEIFWVICFFSKYLALAMWKTQFLYLVFGHHWWEYNKLHLATSMVNCITSAISLFHADCWS